MSEKPMPPDSSAPGKVRISRVYTRTGDAGQTRLVGGQVVPKDHPRLNAYGTVDELQVVIALARDALDATRPLAPAELQPLLELLGEHLCYIQNLLFTVSADLATRLEDRWDGMVVANQEMVGYAERLIDALNRDLPPLKDFVLPGGHPATSSLHLCRVVCRRAEREVEALARAEPIGEYTRILLNRLSDLFFVMARRVGAGLVEAGLAKPEVIWRRDAPPPPMPE
ncbi:MAG TPA: cob(I)yrinic acid a,c-diamide adenosyltransferase [Candidatus Sumerlaeota bacterium]|nr:cob(I)yrinic acid a,c-diamide adenosyltransferase [Candidatus Sumerlaeota bacterium]HPK01286.1 cob(I)yrinic acid a,c-diamide adenosyltransferase [Candidatus Sumerlaeota bacterium]